MHGIPNYPYMTIAKTGSLLISITHKQDTPRHTKPFLRKRYARVIPRDPRSIQVMPTVALKSVNITYIGLFGSSGYPKP